MRHSKWHVVEVEAGMVCIADEDDPYCASVTNDAEYVTMELFREYGNRRFWYYDSMNALTELVHDHGRFICYGTEGLM